MVGVNYGQLRVLIADDFSNFRATVTGMLTKMGVTQIENAPDAITLVRHCESKVFDLILCDYDLGRGKTGQQALEELQHRSLLSKKTIFIIVSAESAKDVVMASYDCEPDDYLMKPITAQVLQKRIARLILRRDALSPVYKALEAHDSAKALSLLIDLSISETRHALHAQKLLGEMFVERGELGKAEKLYSKALQTRQVDWARLGLARVKQLSGELDTAGEWLEKIVGDNPLYLPAYDTLAVNREKQGFIQQVQSTIQQSVDISPKSILRQKKLADVAERNGDLLTAMKALRSTVKLGELSCHATANDNFNFARVASTSIDKNLFPVDPLSGEVQSVLTQARVRFSLSKEQDLRASLLEGRLLALCGNLEGAKALVASAEGVTEYDDSSSLDVNIDRVIAFQAIGEEDKANVLLRQLLNKYAYDQGALQRLDALLAEPVSEANRVMVAAVNREGIELYKQERYDDSVACFNKVSRMFPKHVGVHLNIAQALIGKMLLSPDDDGVRSLTEEALGAISLLVEPGHTQYQRFERLRGMAANAGLHKSYR